MDCLPFTDTPCTGGDASQCRGNFLPTSCHELIHCDEDIPPVELIHPPKLRPGGSSVELWWKGVKATDHIEVIVTMTNNKNGPVYDFNYRGFMPDEDKPNDAFAVVGATMDSDFKYMIAIRRVRGNLASVWTTVSVGEALHHRAFSSGFAVGFE